MTGKSSLPLDPKRPTSLKSDENNTVSAKNEKVTKPKINHHFINPASSDNSSLEETSNKENKSIASKNALISPSLSLNQISKNSVKPSNSVQSAALSKHLINATAPVKSQLCSGFRFECLRYSLLYELIFNLNSNQTCTK